ncbi:hypothetical protein E2C01_040736 [Portunus trituberculatus]|uniref:Uncharacterized protein n=1 Tax=Portunus trituberculatus TaxID=210409 RepID=A0A5B7FKK4_PORTR|nr:hypothetical protein [Portunus trituberculatus]
MWGIESFGGRRGGGLVDNVVSMRSGRRPRVGSNPTTYRFEAMLVQYSKFCSSRKGYFLGHDQSQSPTARKPLRQVRKPNRHSDSGQDSSPCAWRPLGPQSTHGSTVPRRLLFKSDFLDVLFPKLFLVDG